MALTTIREPPASALPDHAGGARVADCALVYNEDGLAWLGRRPPGTIHAVVTDPPYGLLEYSPDQLAKRARGRGGVWRIPPGYDGATRQPLPRFTVLDAEDRAALEAFFERFARLCLRALVPGGHVFIASNPIVSHHAFGPFIRAGFEKRGEIIRVVKTLRGGDRPKGAHDEFPGVSVMPRSSWEPWGLFRKPLEGTVRDNLRRHGAGALRRPSLEEPFRDLIACPPARGRERRLASHPSLKPQRLMRQLVHAALPLGEGVILDPFMGSGSTIAAAAHCGLESIGVEIDAGFYEAALRSIPALAALEADPQRASEL